MLPQFVKFDESIPELPKEKTSRNTIDLNSNSSSLQPGGIAHAAKDK